MFYRRVVAYIPDEQTYKSLKHRLVDDGFSLNALMLKLINNYLNGGDYRPVVTDAPATQSERPEPAEAEETVDAEFWEKEAEDFHNAMPRRSRAKKASVTDPVEMSIREYEKRERGGNS